MFSRARPALDGRVATLRFLAGMDSSSSNAVNPSGFSKKSSLYVRTLSVRLDRLDAGVAPVASPRIGPFDAPFALTMWLLSTHACVTSSSRPTRTPSSWMRWEHSASMRFCS